MKITVVGAAGGEVTGSAYLVQTSQSRVLVDCGLFQGGKKTESKNRLPPRTRSRLDAVLITHAHLDHTGRLPLLVRLDYDGPLFATGATIEMAGLMLRDSARIQQQDAARENRKRRQAGQEPLEPLSAGADTETALRLFRHVPYQKQIDIAPGLQASFAEAGHMLGSASIQLAALENGRKKTVVFSGDLGPRSIPLLRKFQPFHSADVVFVESTYGGRDHRPFQDTVNEFVGLVQQAAARGGKILIPTFAVGRAQLLMALLGWMFRQKTVKPFPIFLDSPMAIETTRIYAAHRELFDDRMTKFLRQQPLREDLKTLRPCVTPKESKAVDQCRGTCLVMAGAGMCTAGRIVHHLKQNLSKPETTVLMVGYQAKGTLGRVLVDGAKLVKIHNEQVAVRASIHTLGGFSAHAGQTELLDWIGVMAPGKPLVAMIHGEDPQRQALADRVKSRYRLQTLLPAQQDVIEV